MRKQFNKFRKYFIPLIVIFLFSNVKAESYDSAFTRLHILEQKNTITKDSLEVKYIKAEKLYKEGNYSGSLELTFSLLKEEEELIQAKVNYLLGLIFFKKKDDNESLKYLKKALKIIDLNTLNKNENHNLNSDLENLEAAVLVSLSKIYLDKYKKGVKNDSAYYFLKKMITIKSVTDDVLYLKGKAYINLSLYFVQQKEYHKAKTYSFKAIDVFVKLKKKTSLSKAYLNLANIYELTNKRKEALETYFKAMTYVEGGNDEKSLDQKEILYYNIAWSMYKLKDYKAYEYLSKSYDLKDSLIDIGLRKELKKIEQIHNIDIIRKEAENKRLVLVRNNWFIGLAGVLVSLLFLYLANLNKLKEQDLKLKLSLKEFEQQKKLNELQLESQSKIINATIDGKETERKQIAETLHDNVSALLSSANMHLQASQKQFGENPPVELQKTQQIITEASVKIRDLSHNLMSSVLLKFGLEYALKDTAKKYSNSTIKIYTAISNVTRYSQEFEIKTYNIIQELINNVLKHSKATSAFVVVEDAGNKLFIIVKDNGTGFEKKCKESTGIGLNQIKERVRIMDGVFNIECSKGEGTKIMLEIPIVQKK